MFPFKFYLLFVKLAESKNLKSTQRKKQNKEYIYINNTFLFVRHQTIDNDSRRDGREVGFPEGQRRQAGKRPSRGDSGAG